jgi:hypothetical protein
VREGPARDIRDFELDVRELRLALTRNADHLGG